MMIPHHSLKSHYFNYSSVNQLLYLKHAFLTKAETILHFLDLGILDKTEAHSSGEQQRRKLNQSRENSILEVRR